MPQIDTWNWQDPTWPQFRYDPARLRACDSQFLQGCGMVAGTVTHLDEASAATLRVELLGEEAFKSSEIEGEILDRESLQSSIRGQLGLASPERKIGVAEAGVAELMVTVYDTFAAPLSEQMLFSWHAGLMAGAQLNELGAYRKAGMKIVSGRIDDPRVHFEAPPADQVGGEMKEFVRWFNASGDAGTSPLAALERAGIAHLYFESIHPFEDGNGRIGRALSEKALAQSVGRPTLIALSQSLHRRRADYYAELGRASRCMEVDDWLAFFSEAVLEAQTVSLRRITFLVEKTKFFDRHGAELNARQEKVLLRVFREGPDGFAGGLSAGNYLAITKTSRATATRDLNDLVERGALTKSGRGKGMRYSLRLAGTA